MSTAVNTATAMIFQDQIAPFLSTILAPPQKRAGAEAPATPFGSLPAFFMVVGVPEVSYY